MTHDCPHCGQDLRLAVDAHDWCEEAAKLLEVFLGHAEHNNWGSVKPLRELLSHRPVEQGETT